MSVIDILYTVLIMPLQLMFEVMFMLAEREINNPGLSIIVLSLMMNFLVLPLYMRADKMQEDERNIEAKLHDGVAHIRKTFKGDEKMMMLQTYYRQNDYRPTDVFKGSISLFLEIPFFISAYLFLSNLQLLHGVSFGVIPDLGAPDGLIAIGDIRINLLPFVMTGINLISCVIFTKGMPRKTKVQLYVMAAFFLVFLYTSPSGLVFYWTLNNLFSLIKTIFYKLKHPGRVLKVLFACVGIVLLGYAAFVYQDPSWKKTLLVYLVGIVCLLPAVLSFIKSHQKPGRSYETLPDNKRTFVAGALFLTVLTGVLIPSSVIGSSPQEFIDVTYYLDPVWYIVSSLCLAVGTFLVWMSVFYWLTSKKYKPIFQLVVCIMCGVALIDYMFFGTNLGILDNALKYEGGMSFETGEMLVNFAAVVAVCVAIYLLFRRTKRAVPTVLAIAVVAFVGMSGMNMTTISTSVAQAQEAVQSIKNDQPSFNLSKNGKNVVVLMLDRGMNEYIPYIMNEKPELQAKFQGFTYYDNVISFGGFTNFGTPSLFGGYDYTPVEMNKRSDTLLVDKQNEALKLMPVLFDQNSYNVTVCDPTYAGYQWKPDLSIYDDYPDIHKYITLGRFSDKSESISRINADKRNLFCFSLVKSLPLFCQSTFYNNGNYNAGTQTKDAPVLGNQEAASALVATGQNKSFNDPYNVLQNLDTMTNITDDGQNNFLMMTNDTTHEPMLLQEPDYAPSNNVDNTKYEAENHSRFSANGMEPLIVEDYWQYAHYQTNVAALEQVANWLDYLKANGVYDNTRIIICADHGRPLHQLKSLMMPQSDPSNASDLYDTEFYYPLLMVKDFNAQGFTTDSSFMTDADVPSIAMSTLIENPVNPFTGNPVNTDEKFAHDQYVLGSEDWDTSTNNGTQYLPGTWFAVHDDRRDMSNWQEVPDPSK